MHFRVQESSGSFTASPPQPAKPEPQRASSSLPFGGPVSLASLSGPAYVTAQLLVQQVAYALSDKIFSFSPEHFDLYVAAKHWAAAKDKNIHAYTPTVLPLQTRLGAGTLALGYIFSPDFDITKRHVPQTLLAPSGSLKQLRPSFDQLSLLYSLSSPFVAHIAAVDYTTNGLVTRYDEALTLAEDMGLSLVVSSSTYEAQHMSLFATLLAKIIPTMHIYDGVRLTRETLRVFNALSTTGIAGLYKKLSADVAALNPRLDAAGKALELLRLLNDKLGTLYQPFEYHGHEAAEFVLVVLGSVESQVAKQTISDLAAHGAKVGVIVVRLYRPFAEEAFLKILPSVKTIGVLGQVHDETAVDDQATQSALYSDVLTVVSFSNLSDREPQLLDIKYPLSRSHNPESLLQLLRDLLGPDGLDTKSTLSATMQQYVFWDVDDSTTVESPGRIGRVFSRESTTSVYLHSAFDNLRQGGVVRTDLRTAKKAIDAAYEVNDADVAVIGDERLLKDLDTLNHVANNGKVILKLSQYKEDELEKRLPAVFRKAVMQKNISLFILDISPAFEADTTATRLLLEASFLKITHAQDYLDAYGQQVAAEGQESLLRECIDALDQCLKSVDVPQAWAETEEDDDSSQLASPFQINSFVRVEKEDVEEASDLKDWQAIAKGLVFKEAFETRADLRPDLPVTTATIRVKENRRLTPAEYDRHIFHIEFDLGDSGLTYKIGEALGIHAENDVAQVDDFIQSYGLQPEELVQVPARADPNALEVRTVHQALRQNIDILGKPPKRFYEALAEFATDELEKKKLELLASTAGAKEFKKRTEVDTATFVDILDEFPSARPSFHDLVKIVSPLKRREYSIASAQAVTPNSVALMIVVVDWVDSKGRTRYGHATRYLSRLQPGAVVTASVKPSVMKLPAEDTAPLIMAGLGTGLAPFRAFVQYRAMQKAQGKDIGSILLYLGSRHQREEYLYGEEWEAYLAAGVVTLIGSAFSRDQPQKIYIQDRMRQTLDAIVKAYVREQGSFYLCGPTWPVPDVTEVLQEAIAADAQAAGRKTDPKKEIERLKEEGRYVLEVY